MVLKVGTHRHFLFPSSSSPHGSHVGDGGLRWVLGHGCDVTRRHQRGAEAGGNVLGRHLVLIAVRHDPLHRPTGQKKKEKK